jgi:hypothetical protein
MDKTDDTPAGSTEPLSWKSLLVAKYRDHKRTVHWLVVSLVTLVVVVKWRARLSTLFKVVVDSQAQTAAGTATGRVQASGARAWSSMHTARQYRVTGR